MSARCIAIGDIHGCSRALRALLDAVQPTAGDVIVTLGDVIDRGPDTRGVLEQLLNLRQRCQLKCVMGNHEEMMLSVISGRSRPVDWVQWGGAATLDSYGFAGDLSVIPGDHVEFLESFVDYVESEGHFFVHANYDPALPLGEQDRYVLRWRSLAESFPARHVSGKTAIVGHTADRSGEMLSVSHLKCLDTYCYGGGWLTAYDVLTGDVWQSSETESIRRRSNR